MRTALAAFATLVLASPSAKAATWIVEPDGGGDFATIQAAVDAAADADTVRLAPGTFTSAGNRGVTLGGKELVVTSQAGAAATTIDCEGADRAFLVLAGLTASTEISGITIRNGDAAGTIFPGGGAIAALSSSPTIRNCVFDNNRASGALGGGGGGAVFLSGASDCSVEDCLFTGNATSADGMGGGISVATSSNVRINGCTFDGNSSGDGGTSAGGGLMSWNSDAVSLEDCIFRGNTSVLGGGASFFFDGGSATAVGCEFERNVSSGDGGAIAAVAGDMSLKDCTFRGNEAQRDGGGFHALPGGGVFRGCDFIDNVAGREGGGLQVWTSRLAMSGCVLTGNRASAGGGVSLGNFDEAAFVGCTLTGNVASLGAHISGANPETSITRSILSFAEGPVLSCDGRVRISCSDVFGNSAGDWVGCLAGQEGDNRNFSADPLFCDSAAGDLTLQAASPCAPGANRCGLVGAETVGCAGRARAAENESWARVKSRYH